MSMRARAWTALLLPPFSWFLFEQGLSAVLHADCSLWAVGLLWSLFGLAGCAIGLALAWPLRRAAPDPADPWLARLACVVAGFFTLAILYQTLAILIVPACVR
jgi:hypothetical protein